MPLNLPSVYAPESIEPKWEEIWRLKRLFHSEPDPGRRAYAIVIPPPNVTGALHMGHALNNTLQDILVRRRRMMGDNALWVPGTDHGGIATQNVVEKILKKEGKSRHDLGRETFLKKMWDWRRETGDTILGQLRKLGCLLDWDRTRFTMDEASSRAVTKAFVKLYREDNLIKTDYRLVNWCPRCATALSDIEVEHMETTGKLWHIRYPFVGDGASPGEIVVATTRPETMLGDTAVAVNPKDGRYRALVGKKIKLPLAGREIPLLADEAVDASFGTGAVKVTPSHDQTDFEIGQRHGLDHCRVIGYDGRMTPLAKKYQGQSVQECRKNVLADLEAGGFLVKEETHKNAVATCYRCSTVIEPLESVQWFLGMSKMAEAAAAATKDGRVRIFPDSWEKPYLLWLENIRDWCISRQIWWGHRIPVWYCFSCLKLSAIAKELIAKDPDIQWEPTKQVLRDGDPKGRIVQETAPASCPACGGKDIKQDPDVLDTWFSSGLWPLTTLGWPDETADLKYYYPTSALVTGHEILYLWVARMVMMGLHFTGKIPFAQVFIHGIVRDKQGRKMSKSLNNVVDPLDVMKKFGTDALRFALVSQASPGRDMQISDENFVGARNFANKIWNATRFALTHLEGHAPADMPLKDRDLADRWIASRWRDVQAEVEGLFSQYDLAQAVRRLYAFFWNDFCDWYIELAKIRLMDPSASTASRKAAQQTLYEILDGVLRALHPFMPFVTEELWQCLRATVGLTPVDSLLAASEDGIPGTEDPVAPEDLRDVTLLMETITAIRTLRSEMNVPPGKVIEIHGNVGSASEATRRALARGRTWVERLARAGDIRPLEPGQKPKQAAAVVVADFELFVPLEGLIDFEKEKLRLQKEEAALQADLKRLEERLNNPDFSARAPQEEVAKAKARKQEVLLKLTRLAGHLAALS